LLGWPLFDRVERYGLARVSSNRAPQDLSIIRIDVGIVSRAADRYIELSAIDQLRAAHRIGIHDDAIDRGTLGSMWLFA
jgi:hypothetical protein